MEKAFNEDITEHMISEEQSLAATSSKLHSKEKTLYLNKSKRKLRNLGFSLSCREPVFFISLTRIGLYSEWLADKLRSRQEYLQKESEETVVGEVPPPLEQSTNEHQQQEKEEAPIEPKRRSARVNQTDQPQTSTQKTAPKRKSTTNTSTKPAKKARSKKIDQGVKANDDFQAVLDEHLKIQKKGSRQPCFVTGCTMREYQLVGLEWLISLYEQGLNGILADEMGLGKTLQTISFLSYLREKSVWGPFMIVGPLSTLSNWVAEFKRFTPSIPVVLYHGSPEERENIRTQKMSDITNNAWKFPIIVTSFEICMNDRKYLQNYDWKYIVVDEGHRIKNLNCKLVKELKSYNSANRLLLTGTPLQNNLSELWSLLNFLMPDIFDDMFDFAPDQSEDGGEDNTTTSSETKTSIVVNLHNILKPFLLRRVKTEVEIDIPKKIEYLVYCPLVSKQKDFYSAALKGITGLRQIIIDTAEEKENKDLPPTPKKTEKELIIIEEEHEEIDPNSRRKSSRNVDKVSYNGDQIEDDKFFDLVEKNGNSKVILTEKKTKPKSHNFGPLKLQNVIMQLRKVCNHPYLFDLTNLSPPTHLPPPLPNYKIHPQTTPIATLDPMVNLSGKFLMLERLLPSLFARGHKVLVFSQMTTVLDILQDYAEFVRGWRVCRIDGGVGLGDRMEQIERFNMDGEFKLFLLSTRAGGLGINLTAADTVIIFDSDWNPQVDLQAQDRVHRIGQTKPVVIYRLLTKGTIETKILEKANEKRKLERMVIHKGQFKGSEKYYSSKDNAINAKDLEEILADNDLANEAMMGTEDIEVLGDVLGDLELEYLLDRGEGRRGLDVDVGELKFVNLSEVNNNNIK